MYAYIHTHTHTHAYIFSIEQNISCRNLAFPFDLFHSSFPEKRKNNER